MMEILKFVNRKKVELYLTKFQVAATGGIDKNLIGPTGLYPSPD